MHAGLSEIAFALSGMPAACHESAGGSGACIVVEHLLDSAIEFECCNGPVVAHLLLIRSANVYRGISCWEERGNRVMVQLACTRPAKLCATLSQPVVKLSTIEQKLIGSDLRQDDLNDLATIALQMRCQISDDQSDRSHSRHTPLVTYTTVIK